MGRWLTGQPLCPPCGLCGPLRGPLDALTLADRVQTLLSLLGLLRRLLRDLCGFLGLLRQ